MYMYLIHTAMTLYYHDIEITTALVLSTRDWGVVDSKVKLTGCSAAFMNRAWGEFSQK